MNHISFSASDPQMAELTHDSTQNVMQNPVIEKLADAIREKEDYFLLAKRARNELLTKIYLHESNGLKEAFEIVAGETYIDWFIRQLDA